MRYRILGTTQALRPDGTPLPVGGTRLRALLTVLALRPGRTVPASLLVEEVWDGDPPADATGALQALVGRLRRALGADAVASVDGGYRLTAAPDDVDLHRFERLAADGRRALADRDPAKAAVVLDDALALWRAPVLADLPGRTAEAARWEARRLDVLRARHTAALALGRAGDSLPELTALCDSHPLDESLQALRLRALRDTGRTAEALAAYEDVRRLLARQLGAHPGPELRALHARLLRPDDAVRHGHGSGGAGSRTSGPGHRGHRPGGSEAVPGPGGAEPGPPGHRPGGRAADPGTRATEPGEGGAERGALGAEPGLRRSGSGGSGVEPGDGGVERGLRGTGSAGSGVEPGHGGAGPGLRGVEPEDSGAEPGRGGGEPGLRGSGPGAPGAVAGPGGVEPRPRVTGPGTRAAEPIAPGAEFRPGVAEHGPRGTGPWEHGVEGEAGGAEAGLPGSGAGGGGAVPGPGGVEPGRREAGLGEGGVESGSRVAEPGELGVGLGPGGVEPGRRASGPGERGAVAGPGGAGSGHPASVRTGRGPEPGPRAAEPRHQDSGPHTPSRAGRPPASGIHALGVSFGDHAPAAPGTGTSTSASAGADAPPAPSFRDHAPATPETSTPGSHAPAAPGTGTPIPASPGGPGTGTATPTPPLPGNLRARLTSFVGREADIEAIRGDLAGARLVTLLGTGGAGKTRLSQEAAEAVRGVARDGVWLVELAPVDDPSAVPEAVLTAVGARETVLYGAGAEAMRAGGERQDDPVERLAEYCGRRRMLIILDNCEHVVEAAARLVEELLQRCPGLTVLATSREPLGVPGELLRPVEPLPEPVALRLLAERGAAARPGFRVDEDPDACAEICRRLDGLPLAIELAAARLRLLTPRQIADRLDDRFRLLTSGSRTVLPRQQTLRAVVDWSWDLLDEDERDVLRRLSVFAGGCDLAAAEAVCGPVALEALASLVDKSLVVAAPSGEGGEMRYRLLETVAEYAGERLDESGRRVAAERAHLTYYRELARTTDPLLRGPGQLAAVATLERESENLRAALQHAVAARDEQEALCLVLSMAWYWQMRDQRLAARTWSREAQTLGPDPFAPPARPAAPLWERCTDVPPPWTGEVLQEARRGVHLVHLACMDTELDAWQTPQAQQKLRVISESYEPGLPQTCRTPGCLWFYAVMLTGDMDRVRVILDATVRTCRGASGLEWELAAGLHMRANLLANRTDWAGDAVRDADESLEIYQRLGDLWGTAEALAARGEAHERQGEHGRAAVDYERAIEHAERLGARAQMAVLTARLGSALLEAGEAERGERLLREVIRGEDGAGGEAMPAARLFLAGWLGLSGRITEAREQLRLTREEFSISHFVVFDAFILGAEAWLDAVDARYEEALTKVRRALERAGDPLSQAIAPQMRSTCLFAAAMALAGVDGGRRAPDAARCLGAAEALLPPGHVLSAIEREIHDRAERHTRTALGDEAYRAAYAEGDGLSVKEAAALV
ncbi:BTAD domain-containing putative transcriptional regulator [Streptomyces sp. ALI-76-A]|uniref:BTAD domain-containing putative transcriptional regulator n=1 Tax=Streptomyces sp. ALI-76-A TaxID=3025736 RepID=UPI0033651C05